MSSLCITRSISLESQDGFYSPSIDLGKDFEYLIRKCIAEKMAREQDISDAFGNDQSEATALCEVASLDMPLDSEKEMDTCNCEEKNNSLDEKPCVECVAQESNDSFQKLQEENVKFGADDPGVINMAVNDAVDMLEDKKTAEVTPNAPGRPDEEEDDRKLISDELLFAEFEFPPLVKGKLKIICTLFNLVHVF